MSDEKHDNPLFAEIMAEKASAYFATVRKMQSAIEKLSAFENSGDQAADERRRLELLGDAAELAWFFIIQREAMKLPYYEDLFEEFEIPDEVRRRMGPKELVRKNRP